MSEQMTLFDLTCCAVGSHARISPTPASEPGLTGSAAACGSSSPVAFASFDHDTCSWRTSQLCLDGALTEYSGRWPRSGTMRSGTAYRLRALVPRNFGRGCSSWQTPTCRDAKGQSGKGNRLRRAKRGKLHVANLCDQLVDLGRHDLIKSVAFREELQGFPIGWTDGVASETP